MLDERLRSIVLQQLRRDLVSRDVPLMLLILLLDDVSDDRKNFVVFPSWLHV